VTNGGWTETAKDEERICEEEPTELSVWICCSCVFVLSRFFVVILINYCAFFIVGGVSIFLLLYVSVLVFDFLKNGDSCS
jgi:hypothetical protein